MDEIWKDIEGYEGYQVSNLGNVRSLDRYVNGRYGKIYLKKGKMLSLKKEKNGYLRVSLHKEGETKMYSVHRLVAKAFIPNPDNLPQVNHINEFDKTDNRVENLEWCTQEYNHNYGTHNKRIGEKLSKPVYQYTLDNQLVKIWASTNECGRNGFGRQHIYACCIGKRNTHKGYKWSYQPL